LGNAEFAMSHDTLNKTTDAPMTADGIIHVATGEPPHVEKWPRAWRYIFIIGGTVALWLAAILIGRWIV